MFKLWKSWMAAAVGCVLALNVAGAAEVNWHTNLQTAAQEAARLNRPLFIDVTASWCGPCQRLKKTFKDETVSRQLNECFVPVMIDADANPDVAKSIGVRGLPTTAIMTADGQILKKLTGYYPPQQMSRELSALCAATPVERRGPINPIPMPEETRTAAAQTPSATYAPAAIPSSATPPQRQEIRTAAAQVEAAMPAVTPAASIPATLPAPTETAIPLSQSFGGACLVTLIEDHRIEMGKPQFSALYRGRLVSFVSAERQQQFAKNPSAYWPANDGECVVTAQEEGTEREGDPVWGAIFHKQVYFFASAEHRQRFAEAPKNYPLAK